VSTAIGSWNAVDGVSGALTRARARPGRSGYAVFRWTGAGLFIGVIIALVASIGIQSSQAFTHDGLSFIWSGTWNPANNQYGAGILLVGTAVTTLVAMVIVIPVGLGFAIFLSEQAPGWIAAPLTTAIDLLASVPSILIGLWALLVLSPSFAKDVEPWLRGLPILGHLFHGVAYGPSIMLASVVLAIMALPSIVNLTRTSLQGVALADREAAMALGATRWQVVRSAVLPAARGGIAAALTLATGRVLGESIAVAMIIGNRPAIPRSLLAPGATLGSALVNQFAEATPGLGTSSVIALGAVLFLLTLAVNAGGQAFLRRKSGASSNRPLPRGPVGTTELPSTVEYRPTGIALKRKNRRITGVVAEAMCALAVLVGLVPLVALIYYTIARGAHAISVSFLTHGPRPVGIPGGGIATAIAGSARIAGLALVMAVPVGLLTALFLFEHKGRLASTIRFSAAVLTGVPSIVIGIFAYAVIVRPMHHFSDVAASFALAVLMVPIMIRANEEALRTVALDLWEAGVALGARRSRVARSVVLRGALPGVISGNLLALARALGETAPLLFTAATATVALPLLIFTDATQPFKDSQQAAWGAALVLLASVLVLSAAMRGLSRLLTRNTR
jgi:phosphate ABC transporter permease protein PstC/phosphate ABC transporter permease subunit PstA